MLKAKWGFEEEQDWQHAVDKIPKERMDEIFEKSGLTAVAQQVADSVNHAMQDFVDANPNATDEEKNTMLNELTVYCALGGCYGLGLEGVTRYRELKGEEE